MTRSNHHASTWILALALGGCVLPDKQIGDEGVADTAEGESASTLDADADADTGDATDTGAPLDPCHGPFPAPDFDVDCDGVGIGCDNAPDYHNPDQLDQDGDGFADVEDLCPFVASVNNTSDSDRDGFGNDCDLCPLPTSVYNELDVLVPRHLQTRNVPNQHDQDGDGVGDPCDNCLTVPNCADEASCQRDSDLDGIGDACEDLEVPPGAGGSIGFAANDDFDQDGLLNVDDACPRLWIGTWACTSDAECAEDHRCAPTPGLDGVRRCDHRDSDGDLVGDECDTCPLSPNPGQVVDGLAEQDDEDGDFVGNACEPAFECRDRKSPRALGLYDVFVPDHTLCCVTTYPGDDMLHDPDGRPIRLDCTGAQEQQGECRKLPDSVVAQPGVVALPPFCAEQLFFAGQSEAEPVPLGGDPSVWNSACWLPPLDQDFDGVGDDCDLCPFAFDPNNEPYIDDEGKIWTDVGAACSGEYAPDLVSGVGCGGA